MGRARPVPPRYVGDANAVNNVHYLRWFESARVRWMVRMASTLDPVQRDNLVLGQGIGVIVAATMCRYRRPVTLGPHRLLLTPRGDHDLRVLARNLDCQPEANLEWT